MYLKQLEMQGFKSFREKIRLKFGSGITGVVGPNGSGKSNVADAVRWVLGEAGAKNLRGQKMEDVIFAGTQNRKPLGFAEVSLVMDNSDRKLNLDYSEVTVTRRLYRSGESAYLINGTACRRKDILELFMDTGIGKEGYSIIAQGKIDEILSTKSEDRRVLFEEAAGIVKYKNRRNEAMKKLENERANLLRIDDIISEIENRLGPLETAADKAKKYVDLSAGLKETEVSIFVLDSKKYEEQADKLREAVETLGTQIEETETALKAAEEKKNEKKESADRLNDEIERLNGEITDLKLKYSEKLNEISLLNSDREHMEKEILKIGAGKELAEKSTAEKRKEIKSKEEGLILKRSSLSKAEEKAAKAEEDCKQLQKALAEKEAETTGFNEEILNMLSKQAENRENIAKTAQLIEGIKDRKSRIKEEAAVNEGLLNEKTALIASLKKDEEKILTSISTLNSSHRALLDESRDLTAKQQQLEKSQRELLTRLNEHKSRIDILSNLEKSYEGYYGGVKAVLKNKNVLKGICGAVGELISVKKEYELAIETALGGSLQNVVTEDESAAKAAVNYLKQAHSGRATFMPLTAARRTVNPLKPEITKAPGFVGTASELVKCEKKYEGITAGLLGRTAVVDNIDNGIALAKKTGYQVKIVTLTGEVFNVGGSITGGSSSKKQSGILSRKNELENLKTELERLKAAYGKGSDSLAAVNFNLTSAGKDIESNRTAFNNENLRLSALRARLKSETQLKADLEKRLTGQNAEFEGLKSQNEEAAAALEGLNASLSENENRVAALNELLSSSRLENTDRRAGLDNMNSLLTSLKLEAEKISSEISSDERDVERLEAEIEEIIQNAENSSETAVKLKADIEKNKEDKAAKTNEAGKIKLLSEGKTEEYNTKLKERYGINSSVSKWEEEIKCFNDTLINLNREKTAGDERLAAVNEKNRSLYDDMWETYEITYPEAVKMFKEDLPLPKLHQRSKELKAKIKALGSIDASAPQEYAEAKARYDFLTGQRADMEKAEKDLTEIADKLEVLMQERFAEQFKAINESFKEVFREMFRGGQANITLSDETDVLNSGIEINAQPPGKKLQSMLLLSGGERALTAMALLFAILRLKPSPFCVLDEVDAALDDANVARYANYIKSLSETTQFIVITHKKGTMQEADTLYGVTMQEQGISKVVSVSLKEADELSES
ncbi:MAG: chromosome segregation protein SMC [Clostridiales bacterium]|nr:chromosome segregation protein SMC [Clostridiales bacterium]